MNLQAMRELVRAQLDLDDTDLPNVMLDAYLQEGYDRCLELETRWPFFASLWTVEVGEDGVGLMPVDARVIEMLLRGDGKLLQRLTTRLAVMSFPPGQDHTGDPAYYAPLNRSLYVYPTPGTAFTLTAIGYRFGADWIAAGAGSECDCDRRLHIPICWYACSLGYAQQEDEVLEQTYANRFKEGATVARDAIMRPSTYEPKQVAYTHYPPQPAGPGGPASLNIVLPDEA